jgi:hypothetical protein
VRRTLPEGVEPSRQAFKPTSRGFRATKFFKVESMSTFEPTVQITEPFFPQLALTGLDPHAKRSYLAIVLWVWLVTVMILALPPAIMALAWAIVRS